MQEIQKNGVYCQKRIAQMIGDQITIFLSFPVENTEIRSIFQKFDQQVQEKSRKIYELSGAESGTLSLLRRTGFRGYRLIRKNGEKEKPYGGINENTFCQIQLYYECHSDSSGDYFPIDYVSLYFQSTSGRRQWESRICYVSSDVFYDVCSIGDPYLWSPRMRL